MADRSQIEWTDATWQIASGCTPVSEGCQHCYSARLAGTRLKHLPRTKWLTKVTAAGRIVFNGTVRFHDDMLSWALKYRAPNGLGRRPRVFVADRSDLFHDAITDEQIDRVFAVMALRPDVDFLVLTKRPERMCDYFDDWRRPPSRQHLVRQAIVDLAGGRDVPGVTDAWIRVSGGPGLWKPLPNVMLGCTVENQARADERRGAMAELAAAFRAGAEAYRERVWEKIDAITPEADDLVEALDAIPLVPPDGGAPTEAERDVAERAAANIAALSLPPPAAEPVAPVNIDAAAQVLAAWIGYAWDGLDERDISAVHPDWAYDGIGNKHMQGGRPALRKIVRRILQAAAPAHDTEPRKVVGVAVKHEGQLWQLPAPARHCHIFRAVFDATGRPVPGDSEQGFVDQHGAFLTRAEAFALTSKGRHGITYSEDLWSTPTTVSRDPASGDTQAALSGTGETQAGMTRKRISNPIIDEIPWCSTNE